MFIIVVNIQDATEYICKANGSHKMCSWQWKDSVKCVVGKVKGSHIVCGWQWKDSVKCVVGKVKGSHKVCGWQ